jgi:hypothetical protein
MKGTIRFEHDHVDDIHIAYVKWFIETEEDCRAWHKQLEGYFSKFHGKVDIIYVCDDLKLGPKIGPTWGKYRADLNSRYTRYSVRVHVDAKVAAFTATSGIIHGVSFEQAPDVATAKAFIKERRRGLASAS